jgi:hypothetical protein
MSGSADEIKQGIAVERRSEGLVRRPSRKLFRPSLWSLLWLNHSTLRVLVLADKSP